MGYISVYHPEVNFAIQMKTDKRYSVLEMSGMEIVTIICY